MRVLLSVLACGVAVLAFFLVQQSGEARSRRDRAAAEAAEAAAAEAALKAGTDPAAKGKEAAGFLGRTKTVQLRAGERNRVEIRLERAK